MEKAESCGNAVLAIFGNSRPHRKLNAHTSYDCTEHKHAKHPADGLMPAPVALQHQPRLRDKKSRECEADDSMGVHPDISGFKLAAPERDEIALHKRAQRDRK